MDNQEGVWYHSVKGEKVVTNKEMQEMTGRICCSALRFCVSATLPVWPVTVVLNENLEILNLLIQLIYC